MALKLEEKEEKPQVKHFALDVTTVSVFSKHFLPVLVILISVVP